MNPILQFFLIGTENGAMILLSGMVVFCPWNLMSEDRWKKGFA